MQSPFAGRMGRRAFIAAYVCLAIAQTAIALASGNKLTADLVIIVPWIWMASRRLHDFNARWFWALGPSVVAFVAGFVRGFVGQAHAAEPNASSPGAQNPPVDWTAVAPHPWDFAVGFAQGFWGAVIPRIAAHPIELGLDAALLLVLALWPGTRGPNRFGNPPGRTTLTPEELAKEF
jgi:uncharacterized membrane protein YhaH (DUF805 family)